MARTPSRSLTASAAPMQTELVSGNLRSAGNATLAAAAAIFQQGKRPKSNDDDRRSIAKQWQADAYYHVNICGEARYAAVLYSNMAGRAEIGVSEPQTLANKPKWVTSGPEVDAFAELAPTVRERTKLIRDYMLHRTIAGEAYLIARERRETDPGYIAPPLDENGDEQTWERATQAALEEADVLDPDFDPDELDVNPNEPIWEIVGVMDLRKTGDGTWQVRHDNNSYHDLAADDPVVRMWNPDPENRREAWSPFKAMLPTLREIEWLTRHIFAQVKSRLLSAGVWFLPENLTFPPPPPDSVEGGEEAIAAMNEAEQFMMSLAISGMHQLNADEVSFPSIVMADAAALESVDQQKLIKFWSDIDDKAMILRDGAIRRFGAGMDLPSAKVNEGGNDSSGSSGSSGSALNHWAEWAKQEQSISDHIEPALDDFTGVLTWAYLRSMVPGTQLVIAYGTANVRVKQDRSKEAIELHGMGLLNGETTLRETGFDPDTDMMDEAEFKRWLLVKMFGAGSSTPEQMSEALRLLTGILVESGGGEPAKGAPGYNEPANTDRLPVIGPPEGDHEHNDAPYSARVAACEVLVLRALEKAGNRLLNDGKRGKGRDRTTPAHLAHLTASIGHTVIGSEFDFGLALPTLYNLPAATFDATIDAMGRYCADLYNTGSPYSREGLIGALG